MGQMRKPPTGRAAKKRDIEARDQLIELLEKRSPGGLLTQARRIASGEAGRELGLRETIARYSPKPPRSPGQVGGNRRGVRLDTARLIRQAIDMDMRKAGATNAKGFLRERVKAAKLPASVKGKQGYVEYLYRLYRRGGEN